MKILRNSFFVILISLTASLQAQEQETIPDNMHSPRAKFEQMVGQTRVALDYGRPSLKGRELGELIKLDKEWRTGANQASTITFDDSVEINGMTLAAGTYAMYTVPSKKSWEIILNKNYTKDPWEGRDKDQDALAFEVPVKKLADTIESFTILVANLSKTHQDAVVQMLWGNTAVEFSIRVPKKW